MRSFVLAVIRYLAIWACSQGILSFLASKGIYPQVWVASLLGFAISPDAWGPGALLLSGMAAFIGTIFWEWADLRSVDDARKIMTRMAAVPYATIRWIRAWKVQPPIVRRDNAIGASLPAPAFADPVGAIAAAVVPVERTKPSVLLKIYKSQIDRQKLDAALYELFQVLNSHAANAKRNAEYNLIHNWETRFVNDGRGVFLGLIDSVRDDVQTALMHINRITYGKEYAYYSDELRDALREDQSSNLLGPLDALKSIAAAVPEKLSLEQLRILMSSQHAVFEKAVEDNGKWLGGALQRVRLKRQALESEA